MRRYVAIFVFLSSIAAAQATVHIDLTFLYLPDAEMKQRIANQDEFLFYARNVLDVIEPTIVAMPEAEPVSFGLIITVRHGRESKVWFSIKSGSLSEDQRNRISSTIEAIRPPEVHSGVVPIAYAVRAWGATDMITDVPIAPEWTGHDFDGRTTVDVLIEKAWK